MLSLRRVSLLSPLKKYKLHTPNLEGIGVQIIFSWIYSAKHLSCVLFTLSETHWTIVYYLGKGGHTCPVCGGRLRSVFLCMAELAKALPA